MRRSRQIIAIVFLASALAVDGTLIAAPTESIKVESGTLASRLVERISVGLHRTIARPYLLSVARDLVSADKFIPAGSIASPIRVTPFRFGLPPPLA